MTNSMADETSLSTLTNNETSEEAAPPTNGNRDAEQHNGNGATKDHEPIRRRKPVWRNIVHNFGAIWFTVAMSTGILGILYNNQPYSFPGLNIISTIMYIFTIILFFAFAIPTIVRWTAFHKTAASMTHGSLDDISMLSAPVIAWFTIVALTALIPSQSWGGTHSFTVLSVVMWWAGTVWMVVTCCGICIALFHHNIAEDRTLSTSIFMPAMGIATAAVTGATICRYGFDFSARLAVPILIMCYFLIGLSIFLTIEMYTLFFHRLLANGWPEPAKLPGLMILVGPFGQTAAALITIGTAAGTKMDFGNYGRGTFLTAMSGSTVTSAGTLIALLLLGHDFFWLVIACGGIGVGLMRRQLTYTLLWWSTIFPIATMTLAFIELSVVMDSPTFRVLAAIFTILLTINYLVNWAFTLWYSIKGDLLIKSDDEEVIEKSD